MRRVLILSVAVVALIFTGCNKNKDDGDGITKIPGLEIGNGSTYKGYPLPTLEQSYEGMIELLELTASQKRAIDDEKFINTLTSSIAKCTELYMTRGVFNSNDKVWIGMHHIDSSIDLGSIKATDEGKIYSHEYPDFLYPGVEEYFEVNNLEGYYLTHEWQYNNASNTLTTKYYAFDSAYPVTLHAELLYFNNNEAVLVGHIAGLSAIDRDNDGERCPMYDMEIFRLEFTDGYDNFLDNYITNNEYFQIVSDSEMAYILMNINDAMSEYMPLWEQYDATTVSEGVVGEWKQNSLLYLDEQWQRVIEVAAYMGMVYPAGLVLPYYNFSSDGTGCEMTSRESIGEEDYFTENFNWSYNADTKVMTISYDNYTAEYKVAGYYMNHYMAWDRVNNKGENERIILMRTDQ